MNTLTPEPTTTAKEWLTSLIGSVPFGILAFDLSGMCTLANGTAGDVFGTDAEQLVDRTLAELIQNWPELSAALPPTMQTQRANVDLEDIGFGERTYNVRCRVIVDGVLLTIDEITAEMRIRREQEVLMKRLETANQELAEFAFICAHDLKSPVSNLVGLIDDMASLGGMPQQLSPTFEMIERSVGALHKNIRSLNEILQVKESMTEDHQAGRIQSTVEDVLDSFAVEIAAAGGTTSVELAGHDSVSLGPSHLRNVIENLVSNAIEYRHPERALEITIRSEDDGPEVILQVVDNGRGFDGERFQEKVFGLFNRLDPTTDGGGIGLYLVRSLVQASGGTVSVESREGLGATFTVRTTRDE